MSLMARGAANLARELAENDAIDGVIAIGGTMGTDLALDVALVLPLGMPKFVVSTIAFSHLIPPERIAADLMMILWAGGLYGLNATCTSVLSQACGAIVGAAAQRDPAEERPAGRRHDLARQELPQLHGGVEAGSLNGAATRSWSSTPPAWAAAPWNRSPRKAALPRCSISACRRSPTSSPAPW